MFSHPNVTFIFTTWIYRYHTHRLIKLQLFQLVSIRIANKGQTSVKHVKQAGLRWATLEISYDFSYERQADKHR